MDAGNSLGISFPNTPSQNTCQSSLFIDELLSRLHFRILLSFRCKVTSFLFQYPEIAEVILGKCVLQVAT